MSVYTTVDHDELRQLLTQYDVGELLDLQGISAGIENTNYFVDTTKGRFVLTLFESYQLDDLPYFLNVMAFLAEHKVPSAHPVARNDGRYIALFKNKPTSLVNCLKGSDVTTPTQAHAKELGSVLGYMHSVGTEFNNKRANGRGLEWWQESAKKLENHLDIEDNNLLKQEIDYQLTAKHKNLPRGFTHADLFKDNALWQGNKLTGIIDFYYACDDYLLYDIAVTVNAWFSRNDGALDADLCKTFLSAYHLKRRLNSSEQEYWPMMLRAGALRFWLSRLLDKTFPKDGEMTHIKNPNEYKTILLSHVENHNELKELWTE